MICFVSDILGAQIVSIMLNGEESELTFQNTASTKVRTEEEL